MKYPLSD